jgi:hypothetical protein
MSSIERRIKRLENQSGVDGRFVFVPLPGREGQFFRLPRPFAEWMAKVGQDDRPINYTDGDEAGDDDRTRQNRTE